VRNGSPAVSSLNPIKAAMLGCIEGIKVKTQARSIVVFLLLLPLRGEGWDEG
jgi:hypothetical protein